jgi:hypothetical protein
MTADNCYNNNGWMINEFESNPTLWSPQTWRNETRDWMSQVSG